jgi:calcineurin-like phosphoesterase family protein
MSEVYFCSDLHFGHKGIDRFRGLSTIQNEERISADWRGTVSKKDCVYVLGDAAFTRQGLDSIGKLPGRKFLVRGNHDTLSLAEYSNVFEDVYGCWKYKEFWLSHAPIHPSELRGRVNLHGHVHHNTIDDSRYFNCCPENLWKTRDNSLISVNRIRVELKNETWVLRS